MPTGAVTVVLKVAGVIASAAVAALALSMGGLAVAEVQESYTCEELDGYDPLGMTAADRYPSDTWAGLCERTKHNATVLQVVLAGIFTAAPGVAIVAILRQ